MGQGSVLKGAVVQSAGEGHVDDEDRLMEVVEADPGKLPHILNHPPVTHSRKLDVLLISSAQDGLLLFSRACTPNSKSQQCIKGPLR